MMFFFFFNGFVPFFLFFLSSNGMQIRVNRTGSTCSMLFDYDSFLEKLNAYL